MTQQTYCQNDFERQILQRLEKLEKAKEELENENKLLKTQTQTCWRVIDDTLQVNLKRYCLKKNSFKTSLKIHYLGKHSKF